MTKLYATLMVLYLPFSVAVCFCVSVLASFSDRGILI